VFLIFCTLYFNQKLKSIRNSACIWVHIISIRRGEVIDKRQYWSNSNNYTIQICLHFFATIPRLLFNLRPVKNYWKNKTNDRINCASYQCHGVSNIWNCNGESHIDNDKYECPKKVHFLWHSIFLVKKLLNSVFWRKYAERCSAYNSK